jgi:hypothetical protein
MCGLYCELLVDFAQASLSHAIRYQCVLFIALFVCVFCRLLEPSAPHRLVLMCLVGLTHAHGTTGNQAFLRDIMQSEALDVLAVLSRDVPRSLWTARGDGASLQWMQFVYPLPGSADEEASRTVGTLFRPHVDLPRQGMRFYEGTVCLPATRQRERAQRADGGVGAVPLDDVTDGAGGGSGAETEGEEKACGGTAGAAAAAVTGDCTVTEPAAKRSRTGEVFDDSHSAAAASPRTATTPGAGNGVVGVAAAAAVPWRSIRIRDIAHSPELRREAVQRRDAALLLLYVLTSGGGTAAHTEMQVRLAEHPGIAANLVAGADTPVGSSEVPPYCAAAIRALASAGPRTAAALAPLAPQIVVAARHNLRGQANLTAAYQSLVSSGALSAARSSSVHVVGDAPVVADAAPAGIAGAAARTGAGSHPRAARLSAAHGPGAGADATPATSAVDAAAPDALSAAASAGAEALAGADLAGSQDA